MSRAGRAAHILAAAIAFAACACERPREPAPADAAPAESAAAEEVVIPPFDPSLPPLEIQPLPPPAHQKMEPPPIRPTRTAKAPTPAPKAPDAQHPPLEALFRAPYAQPAGSTTVDLDPGSSDAPVVPKPPGTIDRLGQSIRLERREEAIGPAGPRQGSVFETEAAVRIPVDKSVAIEGGVRVDSREEPGAKEPDRRPTPRVGVEVRF
jgi:hypothetical protein